jgi:VanZ family protein
MAATLARELHVASRGLGRAAPLDSGARLSRALLSYLVVLIAALLLLPFEFAMPAAVRIPLEFPTLGTLAVAAMFVPYGFLTRRSRMGRVGQHLASVMFSAGLLSLVLEALQLFEPACLASPWHVLAAVVGAGTGAWLCERAHDDANGTAHALRALLLQLPLMGLVYLLLPLLWASGAAATDDPTRLALTLSVGLSGASILGSIARAVRAYTPDRKWWLVPTAAATWIAIGMVPSLLVDWRIAVACIAVVTAFAAWRGRWSAPQFIERRYEVPSLIAAAPFMAVYFIGAGVWPGHSFRTVPLVHLGMPTTEAGLSLVLPLIETGIASTVLGYVIAEFHGRAEASFRAASSRVLFWTMLPLIASEVSRSFFGYEGASLVRAVLSLGAATYGAWLYHLQRDHVKVVAHRLNHRPR